MQWSERRTQTRRGAQAGQGRADLVERRACVSRVSDLSESALWG